MEHGQENASSPRAEEGVMPRPQCFLVSIGNSLITNYLGSHVGAGFTVDGIENLNGQSHDELNQNPTSPYARAYTALRCYLNGLQGLADLRAASAELNSLYHCDPLPGTLQDDKIILLATRTPTGYLCASLLKEILCNSQRLPARFENAQVDIHHLEGLGRASDPRFASEGLPKFLAVLSEKIQAYEGTHDVILIPTGGYKSLIPYATLAGILHKKPVRYIYEDSDVLLNLPPIPVGLDMEQWKAASVFLRLITSQPQSSTQSLLDSLDSSFLSLLVPPSTDQLQPRQFSVIGEFLWKHYDNRWYRSPLQHQTGQANLLRFLARDNGKPSLSEMFQKLVDIGPYLWLGDKIPDMMDHAQHHHTNLFEMADVMLVPILQSDNNFLKPEELFILLCTIYFHDWGHVLSSLPGKPMLLPTEIRDFHHVLGYERLKEPTWQNHLIRLGLDWKNTPEDLWNSYLGAIATIGLFHRKAMSLNGSVSYPCPINNSFYRPLSDQGWNLAFEGRSLSSDRAVFIAALFRILDGLDNQVARAGRREEIRMKAAVLQGDATAEEKRCQEIKELLKEYLGETCPQVMPAVEKLYGEIIRGYQGRETECGEVIGAGKSPLDPNGRIAAIAQSLPTQSQECGGKLIRLHIDASCRAFFKREQPRHYLKHLAFNAPTILVEPSTTPYLTPHIVQITLNSVSEEEMDQLCQDMGFDPKKDNPNLSKIVANIKDEYREPVQTILKQNHLIIQYVNRGSSRNSSNSSNSFSDSGFPSAEP